MCKYAFHKTSDQLRPTGYKFLALFLVDKINGRVTSQMFFCPHEDFFIGDDEVCVAHYRLLYSTEHWFCSDFHVILVAWKQNRVTLEVMLHTVISQVT